MVSAVLIGFLGLAGAQMQSPAVWGGSPGDIHRGLVQSMPYATGSPLFHDNFSPYDYNYYHERRHRVNFRREEQERQKRLQWEGVEKANALWASEFKRSQQGSLPDNPTGPYGVVGRPNTPIVTYTAPTYYPEDMMDPTGTGLSVEVPPRVGPQFEASPQMMPPPFR